MNKIWLTVVVAGITLILFTDSDSVLGAMLAGTEKGITLSFELLAIYVLWSGILALIEDSGLGAKIANLLSPLTNKLFPTESEEARRYIALNFSANLLGTGGAATPLGIKAIGAMKKNGDKATYSMVLFTVINTTSIQLLPTTLISLRAAAGSVAPYDTILPTFIVSTLTTVLAVLLASITKPKSETP